MMIKAFRQNIILFLVALASAVGLCVLSYLTIVDYAYSNEEQYIKTVNEGVLEELRTVVQYNIQLDRYYGLDDMVHKAPVLMENECILVIESASGEILATSAGKNLHSISLKEYGEVRQEITASEGELAGVLLTYYSKSSVRESLYLKVIYSLLGSGFIILVLLIVCMVLSSKRSYDGNRLIPVLVGGIVLQGIFLTLFYIPTFRDGAYRNVESVSYYIVSFLNQLDSKGVHPEDISDLDAYFQAKVDENSFIDRIELLESGLDNSAKATTANSIVLPILETNQELFMVFYVSDSYIRDIVINMVLMFLASIILAIIVMKESLLLSEILDFRRSEEFEKTGAKTFDSVAKALRYGTFLSVTFDYICIAFSALQIREWNQGILGLSPGVAAALSISICSLAGICGTLFMPWLSRRMSGRQLMIFSSLVMVAADFVAFMTTSTLCLVVMRFFAGAGSSGVKQVRYIETAHGYSTEQERSANLSAANNGLIGGLLCGMGFGSVIADVFGYQVTFLVACIGNAMYLLFEYFCVPWKVLEQNHLKNPLSQTQKENLVGRVFGLFKERDIWSTIVLVVVPQYILLMIIVCLIPGRIQSQEMQGVVLTYSNLLNGVAGLYIGEMLYRRLSERLHVPSIQGLMLAIGSVSMFILDIPFFATGFILLSAILTGLVDGIGTPVAMELFMSTGKMKKVLDGTESLMLYSIIGDAVMMIAPFLLELCEQDIYWMYGSAGALALCALFMFRRSNPRRIL